jgi:hypothetical protein
VGLDPRISALASQVAQGKETQFEMAIALEQYLRTEYDYDFSSIFSSQNRTPLSQFLFETKRGHCEYFASALAVMLRTQGIPSRLVTGFSATNLNPLTGYYDIHALDGHAWVEAYVDGLGWMELEPTAYYDGPSVDNQTLSVEQINDYVDRQMRLQQVLADEELSLEILISSLWQMVYLAVIWFAAYVKLLFMQAWYWLLGVGVLMLSAQLAWPYIRPRWRSYSIRRHLDSSLQSTPESAIDHYLEAIDALLRNAGYNSSTGQTIEQYLTNIVNLDPSLDAARMSGFFNRLHYGAKQQGCDSTGYKLLFDRLYKIGYRDLKQKIDQAIAQKS